MAAIVASPALAKPWLKEVSSDSRRTLAGAGLVLTLDALAAVGFAGGLCMGVVTLVQGLSVAAPWLVLAAVSAAARGLVVKLSAQLAARAATAVKGRVRRDVIRAALVRPVGGRNTSGEAMAAAVEGVEALDGYFVRFTPARQAAVFAPVVILIAIAFASPVSAAILVLALAPFVLGMALAGMTAAAESERQFTALERLSGLFLDNVRALPVILAFQAERLQTAALAQAADELQRRTARILKRAFLSSAVLEFFAALSVALVAVYCGFNLLGVLPFPTPETLDLATAFFVLALAPEVYAPMRRLAAIYHERQAAEAAVPRLVTEAPEDRAASTPLSHSPAIRFDGVSVRYPGSGDAVFKDFDLELAAGSVTAIVGASGAGKSTLLHLLLGLAPLTAGEVIVGDQCLSEAGGFASSVAWAGQTPLIIGATLGANIALGRRDASLAEIAEVAARVGLTDAVGTRPLGLDTPIDERGSGLSGGEKRRIALARALLKPAPILLLDEPTANLDAAAEQALLPVIAEAAKGRTVLIATHSESVAALADKVVRL